MKKNLVALEVPEGKDKTTFAVDFYGGKVPFIPVPEDQAAELAELWGTKQLGVISVQTTTARRAKREEGA